MPFDGVWKHDFGCAGTEGVWVSRCAAEPPFFEVTIWSKGNDLCGVYEVNVINHDDSEDKLPMVGDVHGNVARVTFSSSFGAKGIAQISVLHGTLHWKILESHGVPGALGEDTGTYLPDEDVLTKESSTSSSCKLAVHFSATSRQTRNELPCIRGAADGSDHRLVQDSPLLAIYRRQFCIF
jgi:hypothetical protein